LGVWTFPGPLGKRAAQEFAAQAERRIDAAHGDAAGRADVSPIANPTYSGILDR
jgi:hypothetical protein